MNATLRQLRDDPRVSWLFYDADAKVQLRASGVVGVHVGDAKARERWTSSPARARRCYAVEPAPGAPLRTAGSGLPGDLAERPPREEESEPWFERFAVVQTYVDRLDWLWLRARGHSQSSRST